MLNSWRVKLVNKPRPLFTWNNGAVKEPTEVGCKKHIHYQENLTLAYNKNWANVILSDINWACALAL